MAITLDGTTGITTPSLTGDVTGNLIGTGSSTIPTGTTAQRPVSPVTGMMRFNTTINEPEWYDASVTTWRVFSQPPFYEVEYLLVAGGGGAAFTDANNGPGGGGAGGLISSSGNVTSLTQYVAVIGAGGAAQTQVNGSNTTFGLSVNTAVGGGYGAYVTTWAANSGGSGGGGDGYATFPNGAAGTVNQGKAGGNGTNNAGNPRCGGGGGGASAVGNNAAGSSAGNGGAGINWLSLGTYYAGGGGGAGSSSGTGQGGNGGSGGGGNGSGANNGYVAQAGAANSGGGAGAASNNGTGRAGGSGVVIVRYLGSQRGTGGTVTSSSGYTYHTFTSSGTFTA